MLNNQSTQGIQFGRVARPTISNSITKTTTNTVEIEKLFTAQSKLHTCIANNQNLFEINFAQETKTRIDASAWLELQKELLDIEQDLLTSLKQAQDLVTQASNTKTKLDNDLIKNWSTHSKRAILLDLLNNSNTNPEIIESIDEAFLEEASAMLSFTSPTICTELLALLVEQIKDFSALVRKFELAVTSEKQEELLRTLLGDPTNPDEIFFDVFASGFSAMTDFELSLTAIATYLVLHS